MGRCDLCESLRTKNITEVDYNLHIQEKDRTRREKDADKVTALAGLAHVFVIDVQVIKLSPVKNSSSFYFKTKLKVHNFTMHNFSTSECSND